MAVHPVGCRAGAEVVPGLYGRVLGAAVSDDIVCEVPQQGVAGVNVVGRCAFDGLIMLEPHRQRAGVLAVELSGVSNWSVPLKAVGLVVALPVLEMLEVSPRTDQPLPVS